jgi:D-alanyl-D-alanine dipeptidase
MEHVPIPPWEEPPGWRRVPIVECGEPLVTIPTDHPAVHSCPVYFQNDIPSAPEHIRVRQGVLERLIAAAESLPAPWGLRIHDGHRPLTVQQALWDAQLALVRSRFPEHDPEFWDRETNRFVARPFADPDAPPPHRTGGAVDVSLFHRDTGVEPDFGSEFDSAEDASATRFFESGSLNSGARAMRRILFHAMVRQGFANYHAEWWHYEWGNQRWANVGGHLSARYGIPVDE